MNNDLISREALKKALKEKFDDFIPEGVYDEIDNAPAVHPCDNCDLYFKAMTKKAQKGERK